MIDSYAGKTNTTGITSCTSFT